MLYIVSEHASWGAFALSTKTTSASSAADGKSMQDHERRARKVHFEPDTGSSSCTVWVSHISCSCEPRMCRKSYSTVSSTASAASQSASASHFRMCSCTKNRSQPDEERPRAQKRNVWMKYGWEVSQKARRKLNEQLCLSGQKLRFIVSKA